LITWEYDRITSLSGTFLPALQQNFAVSNSESNHAAHASQLALRTVVLVKIFFGERI
jgi:hypothetical protein